MGVTCGCQVTDDDLEFHLALVGKYADEMEDARRREAKRSTKTADIDQRRAEITAQLRADVAEAHAEHDEHRSAVNARASHVWRRLRRVWWVGTLVFLLGLGLFFRFQIVRIEADTRGSLNQALGEAVRGGPSINTFVEGSMSLSDRIGKLTFSLTSGMYVNATDWSLPPYLNFSDFAPPPSPPPPFPPDRKIRPPPPSPRPPGFDYPPPSPSPPPPVWCLEGDGNCVAPPPSPSPPPPS